MSMPATSGRSRGSGGFGIFGFGFGGSEARCVDLVAGEVFGFCDFALITRGHSVPLVNGSTSGGRTARGVEKASEQTPERDDAEEQTQQRLTSDLHGGRGIKL